MLLGSSDQKPRKVKKGRGRGKWNWIQWSKTSKTLGGTPGRVYCIDENINALNEGNNEHNDPWMHRRWKSKIADLFGCREIQSRWEEIAGNETKDEQNRLLLFSFYNFPAAFGRPVDHRLGSIAKAPNSMSRFRENYSNLISFNFCPNVFFFSF